MVPHTGVCMGEEGHVGTNRPSVQGWEGGGFRRPACLALPGAQSYEIYTNINSLARVLGELLALGRSALFVDCYKRKAYTQNCNSAYIKELLDFFKEFRISGFEN